ncbi:MAG: nucleotidyltransferase domain-containing protein [Planctomycetaceae bacterium]|nr:nucleotidyltransferase domain-containing protein [Planctomycetaceae bacterium]
MAKRVHSHPNLIFSVGTQVVTLRDVIGQNGRTLHPRGAVGVVVKSPTDLAHAYRIRFPDGVEESLNSGDLTSLAKFKEGEIGDSQITASRSDLFERVIYQCIIGSQAYGLSDSNSDIDRRGVYLPPAELHWSLYGVPEQLECEPTQEAYWEIQKFLVLALKANPNVLECLYTPLEEPGVIAISGGKVCREIDGEEQHVENKDKFNFHLSRGIWTRM